jgi:hypothetical protein
MPGNGPALLHLPPLQQLQPGGAGVFHRGRFRVAPYEGYRRWGGATQAKAWARFPWPFGPKQPQNPKAPRAKLLRPFGPNLSFAICYLLFGLKGRAQCASAGLLGGPNFLMIKANATPAQAATIRPVKQSR